ncbi:MAG: 4Fe-4S binding protein [candidate division KSB1 bacterium]|nr:4Fe-4S binding protein [candidate division KSB1 bacterium]
MKRRIISIDEEKCTGCGLCIPNCPEGALQIIDGKARLVSDLFCDGLGACIGHCPEGAITVIERESGAYDERAVMATIVAQGANTVRAHLEHLAAHGQEECLNIALEYLRLHHIPVPEGMSSGPAREGSCPGSRALSFAPQPSADEKLPAPFSYLQQWPVQLHLIAPRAPHFRGSDLLLVADCVAYAVGDFHRSYLRGHTIAIACPKLDEGQEIYVEKVRVLIDEAQVKSLTVMVMQVPCCGGLVRLAQRAAAEAQRKIGIKYIVVGLRGEVLHEDWLVPGAARVAG